jgi:hypothetical protein
MLLPERLSSTRAFILERSEGREDAMAFEDRSKVWSDEARLEELKMSLKDARACPLTILE